jgi:hypothetical protein
MLLSWRTLQVVMIFGGALALVSRQKKQLAIIFFTPAKSFSKTTNIITFTITFE